MGDVVTLFKKFDGWFHQIIFNNKNIPTKVYDTKIAFGDIFLNELCLFIKEMLNLNFNVYILKNIPADKMILDENGWNFLKNLKKTSALKDTHISSNIEFLQKSQALDLEFISSNFEIESLVWSSRIDDNNYWFDLILVTKPNFNLANFIKNSFNSIKIYNIIHITFNNLSVDYIKNMFIIEDLSNTLFKFDYINTKNDTDYVNKKIKKNKNAIIENNIYSQMGVHWLVFNTNLNKKKKIISFFEESFYIIDTADKKNFKWLDGFDLSSEDEFEKKFDYEFEKKLEERLEKEIKELEKEIKKLKGLKVGLKKKLIENCREDLREELIEELEEEELKEKLRNGCEDLENFALELKSSKQLDFFINFDLKNYNNNYFSFKKFSSKK